MKKILILSFIILVNLYSNDIKYYLDYKDSHIVKTAELTKEKYLKVKDNLEFYKDKNKEVKWTYFKDKDYDILRLYTNVKEEKKEIKIEENKSNKNIKENNTKEKKSYTLHILFSILLIYFILKIKKKKNNQEILEEVFQVEELSKREELLSYDDLEKNRLEIYNDLKYNKEIDKEKKKKIYQNINQLKRNIKKKKDLEKLNTSLNEIIKGVENE